MKINDALSFVFERPCSTVEGNAELHLALLLLGFHEVEALPIQIESNSTFYKKHVVVSSHTCLSKLLETNVKQYSDFFAQPCSKICTNLPTLSANRTIEALLKTFYSTRFGFACIENKEDELRGLVTLRDLLLLYQKSIFKTGDLTVKEIASSPIHAISKEANLKETLEAMFKHKFRRIFISEDGRVVSDREIIKHLFSPGRIAKVTGENFSPLLDTKVGSVVSTQPRTVSSDLDVNSAALEVYSGLGGCLVCEEGVITPWDIVMKPWIQGRLDIS